MEREPELRAVLGPITIEEIVMPLGHPGLIDRTVIAAASLLRTIYQRLKVASPSDWSKTRTPVHFRFISNYQLASAVTRPLTSNGCYGFHLIARDGNSLAWQYDYLDDRLDSSTSIRHHAHRTGGGCLLAAAEKPGTPSERRVHVYGVDRCSSQAIIPRSPILAGIEIASMEQDQLNAVFFGTDGHIYVYLNEGGDLRHIRTNRLLADMGFAVSKANMATERVILVEGVQNSVPSLISLEYSGALVGEGENMNYAVRDVLGAPAAEALGDRCIYLSGQCAAGFTMTIVSISSRWIRVYHRAGSAQPFRLTRYLTESFTALDRLDFGRTVDGVRCLDVSVSDHAPDGMRFELTLCLPSGIRVMRFGLSYQASLDEVVFTKLIDYTDGFPGNVHFCLRGTDYLPVKYSLIDNGVVVCELGFRRANQLFM